MGGEVKVACGDMLQLPPVKRPSLAMPLDAQGVDMHVEYHEEQKETSTAHEADRKIARADHRAGLGLWH